MATEGLIYQEKLTSNRTEALFVALAALFLLLFAWRVRTSGAGILSALFLFFFVLFLFYSINYRTLIIDLTSERLKLKFGVFRWTVPLENIESCHLDDVSLARIGGAGIHFTFIRGRYRAMFNFLEYPRLALRLKMKQGPVQEMVFSTRQPVQIEQLIKEGILSKKQ